MITRFLLLRHAEAYKNINNRHGGPGSKLTKKGIIDSANFRKEIFGHFPLDQKTLIFSAKRSHCIETAEILADGLENEILQLDNLYPIHLGVIDGLKHEEVIKLLPDVAERVEMWREGRIEISEINVPKMENPKAFYKRGENALDEILSFNRDSIVILTRSLLVLLTSILMKRTVENGGNYREIKWRNLDYVIFSYHSIEGIKFHVDQSQIRI